MKFNITSRSIEVTDRIRNQVEKKLSKLSKFFSDDTTATITLGQQKDVVSVEVTIPVKGSIIRAEESAEDLYGAIDLVDEILEKQISKHRSKLIDKNQQKESFSALFREDETEEDEDEIRIERIKRFTLKPMDPEEACLQMDLLGHSFFVFKNSETDETAVVYKRKNNTYGLIEPEN